MTRIASFGPRSFCLYDGGGDAVVVALTGTNVVLQT